MMPASKRNEALKVPPAPRKSRKSVKSGTDTAEKKKTTIIDWEKEHNDKMVTIKCVSDSNEL